MQKKQTNFQDNEKSIFELRAIMSNIKEDSSKEAIDFNKMKMMVSADLFDIKKNIYDVLDYDNSPEVQHLYADQLRRICVLEDILANLAISK